MIELREAIALVEATAAPLPPRRQRLLDAYGLTIAAPIVSDVDSPPWDRAMMDGFAIAGADIVVAGGGDVDLEVVVDLAAGDTTTLRIGPGSCARIMTGAPIPAGTDAVVPVECVVGDAAAAHAGGRVRLRDGRFRPGQHVARQGESFRRGDHVLAAGAVLGAAETGLAAEAGTTHVVAMPRPRVAILSTGSELVSPAATPVFGQTRNSNGPMLAAAVTLLGAEPIPLGGVADRGESIRAAVAQGLAADVLLVSGGVSAGDLDLVPGVLHACGVERVFHKVRHKPGKPVWFGVLRRAGAAPTLVFGLPGNPASSLVCFDIFVRPALMILAGRPPGAWHLPEAQARLTAAAKAAADRPVYLPCRLAGPPDALLATPLPWTGSSDLRGFAGATGYIALPAGGAIHEPGTQVDVVVRSEEGMAATSGGSGRAASVRPASARGGSPPRRP